jgi:ketosteroid isomerase-like protein
VTRSGTQIDGVIESYKAAVLAADAESLIRLYEPSVSVFEAWGAWLYEGAAAWKSAVEAWLNSLGSETVRVDFSDVKVLKEPPVTMLNAIVTYAAESASGEALRSMQNRITWVLRENDGVLHIVHEHTSAPIGFEDAKAILQRE